MRANADGANTEAFRSQIGELSLPVKTGDNRRSQRCSHYYCAILFDGFGDGGRNTEKSRTAVNKFPANSLDSRRFAVNHDRGYPRANIIDCHFRQWIVPEPQTVAVVSFRGRSDEELDSDSKTDDQYQAIRFIARFQYFFPN